jgi:hypothetical protein
MRSAHLDLSALVEVQKSVEDGVIERFVVDCHRC